MIAEVEDEIGESHGYSRYRDPVTQSLGLISSTWESLHKAAQAAKSRADYGAPHTQAILLGEHKKLFAMRESIGRKLAAQMKEHVLWPWLEGRAGLQGPTVARVISMIGDPLRFPGRHCTKGHHLPSDWNGPCGIPTKSGGDESDDWVPCGAEVGAVRRGTGVRALWHFAGLHVVNGKAARRQKGVQCSWRPSLRVALIAENGVADQIVKLRPDPWRSVYDSTKERIARERGDPEPEIEELDEDRSAQGIGEGAEKRREFGSEGGPRPINVSGADPDPATDHESGSTKSGNGAEAGGTPEVDPRRGLRPIQIHDIARTVAVKAFLGDLLIEWKRLVSDGRA